MKDIKVLLIEHNEKRFQYKDKIEQAIGNSNVVLIEEYDPEELKAQLKNNYFDFVFTDAFFLPKGIPHDGSDRNEQFLLKEIVQKIREFDKRTKVILYTQFNEKISGEQLDGVDYVFDKRYISSDLFVWQIKRFIDKDLNLNYNEYILIKRILDFLQVKTSAIWRDELIEMLEKYRNGINEIDQINIIKASILILANKCGYSDKAIKMFEAIQIQESLNIAGNPTKWGHLRHVINVFWLGYYIINNDLINIQDVSKNLYNNNILNNEECLKSINKTWFIASIFHDIGNIGEKIDDLVQKINESLSIYPVDQVKNKLNFVEKDFTIKEFESFKGLIVGASAEPKLYDLLNKKHTSLKPDHGVLSASTIYNEFKGAEDKNLYLIPAIRAIAFHNLLQKNRDFFKDFSFKKEPLINLLIFCDLIEVWDRNTGFESIYNNLPLEKIELSNIFILDNILNININYRLHNSILPHDTVVIKSRDRLIEIISREVIPVLELLDRDGMLKFVLDFKLNDNIPIQNWPIKEF